MSNQPRLDLSDRIDAVSISTRRPGTEMSVDTGPVIRSIHGAPQRASSS